MPYWCSECRNNFSVRTGTILAKTRVPLCKWAFAVYLFITNLKGISSMKLHREIGVTQKTAWFMLHRLRESWNESGLDKFAGSVEANEAYMGGKRKNTSKSQCTQLSRRGLKDKKAVADIKDRDTNKVGAKVVENTESNTLHEFIRENVAEGLMLFTDNHRSYIGIHGYSHHSVKHLLSEFVDEITHVNGMESFWSMLKRGHTGTYHRTALKHLQIYADEFTGRHGVRGRDTINQMAHLAAISAGKN